MRLYASRFRALVALLLAVSAHRTVQAATCKTLLADDSTLAKSLAAWTKQDLSAIDFATVFKEVDTAVPWLSKCAAAIDPKAVYTSLASSSSLKTCLSTLENIDEDLSTNEGWANMCPVIEDKLTPCVETIMAEIMDAIDSTSGCCDDFLDEVKTLFGDSLDAFVIKLTKLSVNVECSERTFKNLAGTSKKEMCGYSNMNAFTFIESEDDAKTLLNLAQIPNDQMCNAFEGKAFTNTKGVSTTIGFGTNGVDTMGICLEPIDTLAQYMSSWGIFSETLDASGTKVSLSDLFTSGKSIQGDLFISYATTSTNLPLIGLRATDKVIKALGGTEDESDTFLEDWWVDTLNSYKSDAKSVKIHIPNNGGCTYSDQSITVPNSEAAASVTTADNAASSVMLSGIVTAGVALVSTLLLSGFL